MGSKYILECKHCKRISTYNIGGGFLFDVAARHLRESVLNGKYGHSHALQMKEALDQDLYPNPIWHLYQCKCGYWTCEPGLELVRLVPITPPPEVEYNGDRVFYRSQFVKRQYHHCPVCRKRMKRAPSIWDPKELLQKLKCPHCSGELSIQNKIMWD